METFLTTSVLSLKFYQLKGEEWSLKCLKTERCETIL